MRVIRCMCLDLRPAGCDCDHQPGRITDRITKGQAMRNALPLPQKIERDTKAVRCSCGGYCEREKATADEARKFGCGRDRENWECCVRAFVCVLCGKRYAGCAPAPEME